MTGSLQTFFRIKENAQTTKREHGIQGKRKSRGIKKNEVGISIVRLLICHC